MAPQESKVAITREDGLFNYSFDNDSDYACFTDTLTKFISMDKRMTTLFSYNERKGTINYELIIGSTD